MARRLAAIMFTDIVGYSALGHIDEPGALRLLQEQERLLRPILELHHGRRVKSMGDGLLLEFPNALDAVECAVELQRRVHERAVAGDAKSFRIRVGIHLGDVQRHGTDILGDAVNIAARLEPLAEPGGICLSEQVFAQVRHRAAYQFSGLGPRALKGISEPVIIYRVVLPWTTGESVPEPGIPRRLAVLPLTNISPDPNDEYFADGLTEELITVLSQIRGLRVISRTSVFQYKGTKKPIAQISSELGADSVLEGSVRKAGDQLRISFQLIDARTDEHRWAQTYDRKLENVFAIQTEVAERTAGALRVELLESEREAIQERPTSNLRAYESYLRGIRAYRRLSEVSLSGFEAREREVQTHLETAIKEDPKFGAAYSYLANHLLGVLGVSRTAKEIVPQARELVAKALELNPNSSDAHAALGNLAMQADLDWVRAEAEFQQAIALNPSNSTPRLWYGSLLIALQRFEESRKQLRAAISLDPLWLMPRYFLAITFESTGDREAAIASVERLAQDFPDVPGYRDYLAYLYAITGRTSDALKLLETMVTSSDFRSRAGRCDVLALVGKPEELRGFLADWESNRLPGYFPLAMVAAFYSLLGKADRALGVLERDCREGDKTLWCFYMYSEFDPIRRDPRFIALLRSLRLPTTIPTRQMTSVVGSES